MGSYQGKQANLTDPAGGMFAITPADSEMTRFANGLYIGAGGTLKITTFGNDVVASIPVFAGQVLPVRVRQVWSTGTTATSIYGLD